MRGSIGTEWKFTAMLWATFRLCAHDCCRGSVIVSSWNSLSDLVSFLHSDLFVPLGTKAALYVRGRKQEGFLVLCPKQICMWIINQPSIAAYSTQRHGGGGHPGQVASYIAHTSKANSCHQCTELFKFLWSEADPSCCYKKFLKSSFQDCHKLIDWSINQIVSKMSENSDKCCSLFPRAHSEAKM